MTNEMQAQYDSYVAAENERIISLKARYPNLHCSLLTNQRRSTLAKLRNKHTKTTNFVYFADRVIASVLEDALDILPGKIETIEVPTQEEPIPTTYFGNKLCAVTILRAAESMEHSLRFMCPGIRIGKVLVQRNEKTLLPELFYSKLPKNIANRKVIVLDPMLATGGSAALVIDILVKEHHVSQENIIFVTIFSCPEGISNLFTLFPEIQIVTAVVDEKLNDLGYIIPGVGDFGDRYFGTQ